MTHAQNARALQDEFETVIGFWPRYPRSRVALENMRGVIDRYKAAHADLKALDDRKRGAKRLADEFARLGKIDAIDVFDLGSLCLLASLKGSQPIS